MVKLILQLLTFLLENCQLLTNLLVLTFIFLLLAKSIKKHPEIYYFVFAIPAILFILRQILSPMGLTLFDFPRGSVMGNILREYVHVSGFAYPLLIIIMYMGALPIRNHIVKRLMMIRKELSIISGFPILIHSWVRLRLVSGSFDYFFGSGEVVRNGAGAGFTNAAYLLGIVMAILFLVLWVTSFDVIHKWLGALRWKKVQRWSYVLYAMLFIHSICLNIGRLLGSGGHGGDMTLITTIAIVSTCLVFGSYLILRLRKARKRL
jgi:DMSO/TMAO reductase YedYZ heme-binding membrane subunit